MTESRKKYDPASLGAAIRNLSQNLAALRDFVDLVYPVLRQRIGDDAKEHAPMLLPLAVAFSRLGIGPELTPEEEQGIRAAYGAHFDVRPITDASTTGTRFEIDIAPEKRNEFATSAVRVLGAIERRAALLYGSALVSLLSSAEWFVAQLLHVHFRQQPGALGFKEKVYSLEDLQSFASLDDAQAHLIDSRIENTLRGSMADWLESLKSKVGLSMGYVDAVKPKLIEIGQRRNLIVHNDGLVNSIYIAKVEPEQRKNVKIGDKLPVERQYLDEAIELIERIFIVIGAELWKKLEPSEDTRGSLMNELSFEHLKAERWSVSESLSFFTRGDKALAEYLRLIATVNYWQALKWQGRFGEVRAEIEAADFSAKEEVFQVARMVLLDNYSSVVEPLRSLLDHGKLPMEDLLTWPLFQAFRKSPEYREAFISPLGDVDAATGDA